MDRQERIRKAAFSITAAWEGGLGYANYQTYDSGIISYGRFQFTLAAGSLWKVVETYLKNSQSDVAQGLKTYASRIEARDAALKSDGKLKELLVKAADEEAMQEAQDSVVIARYWTPSQDSVNSRGVTSALGQALFFDMAVQHGPANKHIQTAEANLGAPPKSRLGENGLTEHQLIAETARVRQEFLDRFATNHNLPGVRKRGNFWVDLVSKEDWDLAGDADGNVFVYGKPVLVRLDATETASLPVAAKKPEMPAPPPKAPEDAQLAEKPKSRIISESQAPTVVSSRTEVLESLAPTEKIDPAAATATPSAGGGEPGEPYKGLYVASTGVNIRTHPSASAKKVASLAKGGSAPVKRRYAPSAAEEWFQTAYGWVARLHPSSPGEVFGEVTPD
jgi:hypothetical protein